LSVYREIEIKIAFLVGYALSQIQNNNSDDDDDDDDDDNDNGRGLTSELTGLFLIN